jgi:hypothetical protein
MSKFMVGFVVAAFVILWGIISINNNIASKQKPQGRNAPPSNPGTLSRIEEKPFVRSKDSQAMQDLIQGFADDYGLTYTEAREAMRKGFLKGGYSEVEVNRVLPK